jgi:hypothetical protein
MNQGRRLPRIAQILAASLLAAFVGQARGQSAGPGAPHNRRVVQPTDGPNVRTDADDAAIELVDSLFGSFAPEDPLPNVAKRAIGVEPPKSTHRQKWAARLARNPRPEDGNPPYVLIDRYGGVQRYIEPVPQVDLDRHLGETVAVRRDTGGTLLASQLELPRVSMRRGATAAATAKTRNGVQLAAQEEPLPTPLVPTPADDGPMAASPDQPPSPTGETIDAGPMMYEADGAYEGEMIIPDGVDPLYLDGDSEFGNQCTVCGDGVCGGQGCLGGCGFGSRPVFYARGEYLLWAFDGMNVPALVVSSNDEIFDLDDPIIFGNSTNALDDARSGARITLGYWLDDYGQLGIEGDYITFGDENLDFVAGQGPTGIQNAPPFIGRPFFNMFPFDDDGDPLTPDVPGPAVEEVDTQNLSGSVAVHIESQFQSAGLHIRRNLCCIAGCNTDCGDGVACGSGVGCGSCTSCGGRPGPGCPMCPLVGKACDRFFRGGTRHVDMIYGVRWAQLKEQLNVTEDLVSLIDRGDTPAGTTFDIHDNFATSNEFMGGEIGWIVDWERRRWSLELMSKLAIGNTRQQVNISGVNNTTQPGQATETFTDHGLLVQPSNAGTYNRNEFSVIPQIGLTGGYQVTQRLRLTAGYTLLYWTRVARPGDQISLDVDARQLPPPTPDLDLSVVRPQFVFRDTDIWAHGLNAGIDYRW